MKLSYKNGSCDSVSTCSSGWYYSSAKSGRLGSGVIVIILVVAVNVAIAVYVTIIRVEVESSYYSNGKSGRVDSAGIGSNSSCDCSSGRCYSNDSCDRGWP